MDYFNKYNYYFLKRDIIIKIQNLYRNNKKKKISKLKGDGYLYPNRILNKEDFFYIRLNR